MGVRDLRSVRQLAKECPVFTESSLRWLIFNSEENGLESSLVRIGRRVFIDLPRFEEWLREQQQEHR